MTSSMAFKTTYRFLLRIIFVVAVLGSFVTSCSSSSDMEMVADNFEAPIVEIKIAPTQVAKANATVGSTSSEYEEGTGDENYIREEGKYMKIYFFDANNVCIGKLTPMVRKDDADGKGGFSVQGFAPAALANYQDFKVAVVANLDLTNYTELVPGSSKYNDLFYEPKFNTVTKGMDHIGLDRSKNRLMPFFGVHDYKNVTVTPGKVTELDTPIRLIRAMAKIEVEFDNTSSSGVTVATMAQLESITLCGYNSVGYVAPMGVYQDDTYLDADGNYILPLNTKYMHTQANNRYNEDNAVSNTVLLQRVTKASKTENEKWIGYTVDYQNEYGISKDQHAYLKVKFAFQPGDECFRIDFANYQNGKPVEKTQYDYSTGTDYLNIVRNHIYRFKVNVVERGKISVQVNDWNNAFDNKFEFQ